jgi:hypothetical protein
MNEPASNPPATHCRRIDEKPPILPNDDRRTVIPTPRTNELFRGWGVRF